jgi:hypothetical protein
MDIEVMRLPAFALKAQQVRFISSDDNHQVEYG